VSITDTIVLMSNSGVYPPSASVIDQAHVKEYDELYRRSIKDKEGFWAEQASLLEWDEPWTDVFSYTEKPFFTWFKGAKTNIVRNAIDRHVRSWRRNKVALMWEGEPGDKRVLSYEDLDSEVQRFGSILKSMGVRRGEIVTIYMPQIPELPIAMLACAKIGAAHSVVYGGFSHEALASRIADAGSRVVVTADGGWRRGNVVDLKSIVNQALKHSPTVEVCITVKRTGHDVEMVKDRDYWLHDLAALPVANVPCSTEVLDSEDPLFVLYTSGTTGAPKGLIHTHGGYSVYTATTLVRC
jgi:acetyl-CoA synthetase